MVLGLHFARDFRRQLSIAGIDLARFQRTPKGAQHSTRGGGDDVINGRGVRLPNLGRIDFVVLGNRPMHAVNYRLRLAGQVRDAHRPPLPLQPRLRHVNDVSHCFLPLATLQQFTVVSCKLLVLEGGEERRRGNWSHGGTAIPGVCVRVAGKGLTRQGVRKWQTKDLQRGVFALRCNGRVREGVHPRGDRKYAQSSEGTGDRGATWRMSRWKRSSARKCWIPHPRCFAKRVWKLLKTKERGAKKSAKRDQEYASGRKQSR